MRRGSGAGGSVAAAAAAALQRVGGLDESIAMLGANLAAAGQGSVCVTDEGDPVPLMEQPARRRRR